MQFIVESNDSSKDNSNDNYVISVSEEFKVATSSQPKEKIKISHSHQSNLF